MQSKLFTATLWLGLVVFQGCSGNEDAAADTKADTSHTQAPDHSNLTTHNMNNDLMNAMNSSMEKMKSMKMTGEFEHDFAMMMIEHHQGAVNMCQVEVSKGSDATIKEMANKMMGRQKSEISTLQNFIRDHKPTDARSDGHNHLHDEMQKMEAKMNGIKMTGNLDKDFAMMMIPHHESAIKMAEDEITHGKNLNLKRMAQNMMDDQRNEITELQVWLDKNK